MEKSHKYKTTWATVALFTLLLTGVVAGAQPAKPVEVIPADYGRWGTLGGPSLAPDGKWVAFSMSYGNGADTLFIQNTSDTRRYNLPAATFEGFGMGNWLAYRRGEELFLFNPGSSASKKLGNVEGYHFSVTGRYCVYTTAEGKLTVLHKLDMETGSEELVPGILHYSYDISADALAYATNDGVSLMSLGKKSSVRKVCNPQGLPCRKIIWQESGRAFCWLSGGDNSSGMYDGELYYYDILSGRTYSFNPAEKGLAGKLFPSYPDLKISRDGQRIFFPLAMPLTGTSLEKSPEIWSASTKEVYPREKLRSSEIKKDIWVWCPKTGKYRQLTDSVFSKTALSGDQKFALVWNPLQNEPHPNLSAPVDYYVYDAEAATRELFVAGQSAAEITMLPSPGGKYIAYFRDRQWYIYDFYKKTHTCITAGLETSFYKEDFDWPEEAPPYGNPGWTENDGAIILYDRYDIWQIRPDGSKPHKITEGRDSQTAHRICLLPEQRNKVNFNGLQNGILKANGPYVIRAKSPVSTAYYRWESSQGMRRLLASTNDLDSESFNAHGEITAIEQSFTILPQIVSGSPSKSRKVLYQGNTDLNGIGASDVRLISYEVAGISLKGALYFPVNYDPGEKYPMIVHIYQKQAWDYQRYIVPTLENVAGFNIRHMTLNGYFVFLPDIAYEMGYPGKSALSCVTSAVEAVLGIVPVDRRKIGLIGHSFGGYETNYIVTQTDIFAAAVSGAGISDFTSFYHYVVPGFERPNFWFLEHGQFRMASPYYANKSGYIENSPLYNAEEIDTPLLSWAGRNDGQVHYFQTLSMHLALRRLGKVNYALIYPGEGHIISDPEFQKDLTIKISDWFGYYLKGEPRASWMD